MTEIDWCSRLLVVAISAGTRRCSRRGPVSQSNVPPETSSQEQVTPGPAPGLLHSRRQLRGLAPGRCSCHPPGRGNRSLWFPGLGWPWLEQEAGPPRWRSGGSEARVW